MIRRSLISILFLFVFPLGAATEWNGALTVGANYNSNVEYLYLFDRLNDPEPPRKDGFFATLNGEISLSFGDEYRGKVSYALFSESGLDRPELSRFDQFLGGTFSSVFGEKLLLDISVVFHHAAERWPVPRQLYLDLFGWLSLVYDHDDRFSTYGTARAGYYRDIDPFTDRRFDYFRGPAAGLEGGWYIYPTAGSSYLKTGGGVDLVWLRDEEYDLDPDRQGVVLGVSNKYLSLSGLLEGAYVGETVTLSLALRYTYQYWLGADMFPFGGWEKRRIEHTVLVQPEVEYRFLEHYAVRATAGVMKKMSNIGENKDDYTDYSMLQFTGALLFSVSF